MPYITSTKRPELDGIVDDIQRVLRNYELDDPDNNSTEGNINYLVTKLLKTIYPAERYKNINDAIGLLECIKLEYYRIDASPYEDRKRADNGEVEHPTDIL